jgi:hypothetical protein
MGEWLGWAIGSICGAFIVFKFVAGAWCLIDLRRKWRAVPELWGVDWLDIVYRVEREFGVSLTAGDFAEWPEEMRIGLTAGQVWELVASKLRAGGSVVPDDGWGLVVGVLSDALNVRPERIAPESRLYADLGMVYGLD